MGRTAGTVLLVLSLVPLGFLVYTLSHLEKIGISFAHPRVIVELTLVVIAAGLGVFLLFRS